jgi:outer membrane cobalamin receptor
MRNLYQDIQGVIRASLFLLMMISSASVVLAGTTGKIAGTVTDVNTGEPLIGATVTIVGTKLGAKTDLDGNYAILNVPPGVYEVRVSYVGYQNKTLKGIKVSIDLTARADFKMGAEEVQAQEVVITAERPLVIKDMTATRAAVGAEEIKALPIQNPSQVLEIQGGVVGGTVRGGRRGEVAYIVDGFAVNDVYDGNQGRGVNNIGVESQAIQELELLTGGYNAEYGQAMSGVVNVVTKEGGAKYEGSVQTFFGDFTSGRNQVFQNINSISPFASRDIQGSASGPVPGLGEKLTFFVNGRYFQDEGRFYGQRVFQPGDILPASGFTSNAIGGYTGVILPIEVQRTDQSIQIRLTPEGQTLFQQFTQNRNVISDADFDRRFFVYPGNVSRGDFGNQYRIYERLDGSSNYRQFASGDGSFVPMNPYRKFAGMGKLTFRPTGSFKISGQFMLSDENFQDFDFNRSLIPETQPTTRRQSYTGILNLTHTLSSNTFYNLGVSYLNTNESNRLYDDPTDPRYLSYGINNLDPGGGFSPGQGQPVFEFQVAGLATNHFSRSTTTINAKGDLNSQLNANNLLKIGVDAKFHQLDFLNRSLVLSENQSADGGIGIRRTELGEAGFENYNRRPIEFAAYIQDKFEANKFIVNLGLRLDVFAPDGIVANDPSDPSIYDPIRIENLPIERDANGNPVLDPTGRPIVIQNNRQNLPIYVQNGSDLLGRNFRSATLKWQLSPRLGMAFPITEQSILRFFYGQMFQIPNFEFLYRNPYFRRDPNASISGPFGNADLNPQKTIKGELGLQQQFGSDISLDISLYFNDMRNLNGTAFLRQFFDRGAYTQFVNTDYALVRGSTVSLNKRFGNGFDLGIDYTFQIAQGRASDPSAAAAAIAAEAPIPTVLIPLDWDQRHTFNLTAFYRSQGGWEFSTIARYGSGFPYTPDLNIPFPIDDRGSRGQIVTNSLRRPATFTMDIRAQKTFTIGKYNFGYYIQVYNLFDADNLQGNYPFSLLTPDLIFRNIVRPSSVNTPAENLRRPQIFAPPRQILTGVSLYF